MSNTIETKFILAGNAVFTISNDSGQHYTFKIIGKKTSYENDSQKTNRFVFILTGPNNNSDYTYLGMIVSKPFGPNEVYDIKLTKASRYEIISKPVRVLQFALRVIQNLQQLPDGYKIQHEGRCGRCGKTLTTPESIERGFGPECSNHV